MLNLFFFSFSRDDVQWDEDMTNQAIESVAKNSALKVDEAKTVELQNEAHGFWDKFYQVHQHK